MFKGIFAGAFKIVKLKVELLFSFIKLLLFSVQIRGNPWYVFGMNLKHAVSELGD